MVLNLTLSPELENRLRQEAERLGASVDAVTLGLLEQHLPRDTERRRAAAAAMVRGWAMEDSQVSDEAAAENAAVLRAVDEHRSSYRKLFDSALKGHGRGSTGAA